MQAKTLKLMLEKKCLIIPSSFWNPAMQAFVISVKEKKKINRDSLCVILSKISTLSTSVIISWKAQGRKRGGKKKKKNTHEETKKWESGGVHCASSKDEYLKGNSGFLSLGLRNYGGAFPICCNLDICNWKRNLPELTSVKHSALTGD